ncbi:fibronectin type III domain-containing protein [Coraliomargarita sp. W4R72]
MKNTFFLIILMMTSSLVAQTVSDDFTRPTNVSLTSIGSKIGSDYWIATGAFSVEEATGAGALHVRSQVKSVQMIYKTSVTWCNVIGEASSISAVINLEDGHWGGVAFNVQANDDSQFYIFRIKAGSKSGYQILERDAGSNSEVILSKDDMSRKFSAGTDYELTVTQTFGGDYTFTVTEMGDSTILNPTTTFSDNTYLGGYAGLYSNEGGAKWSKVSISTIPEGLQHKPDSGVGGGPQVGHPEHLIFTYQGNPATSFTANWQVLDEVEDPKSAAIVYYDTVSRDGDPEAYAYQSSGKSFTIDGLNNRTIYRSRVDGLIAATTYYLIVGNSEVGFSNEVKVRTLAGSDSELRFVTGGDMGTSEDTRLLLRHSASRNPQFAVIGGDIAYANGKLESVHEWDTWLKYYTEEMVTEQGFQIPVVLAVGNHEVRGAYEQPKSHAPFFFGFFAQDPDHSYFSLKFNEHFALMVLDSGHITTHESQSEWLRGELERYSGVTHRAAVYHVPLYPSHRDKMNTYSSLGRTHWGPIFDEYQLTVAFENHDHSFKRSHLLKGDQATKDGSGTLYLGDGCWGIQPRNTNSKGRDYLAKSGNIQHFWLVDVSAEKILYRAIDLSNQVFDVYPIDALGAAAAAAVFNEK